MSGDGKPVSSADREANADQLAADAAAAADMHGVASREHDLAMDAHAEYVKEHQLEAG